MVGRWLLSLLAVGVLIISSTPLSAYADSLAKSLTIEQAAQLLFMEKVKNGDDLGGLSLDLLLRAKIGAENDNAPPYIQSKNGLPVMQVAVLNRTKLISSQLLNDTFQVIEFQVNRDFKPFYGISFEFYVFEETPENLAEIATGKFALFVITDLLVTNPGAGILGFHDKQQSVSNFNGAPISTAISDPPDLPNGTPYIIVPMGSPKTKYGIVPASLSGDPTLPPTFATIFSNTCSHEMLETLANYAVNKVFLFVKADHFKFYEGEVCDPVEFTPGYVINDLFVADFVLPSWYVTTLTKGPFSFLETTTAPLTPQNGEIFVIIAHKDCKCNRSCKRRCKCIKFKSIVSFPDNPSHLISTSLHPKNRLRRGMHRTMEATRRLLNEEKAALRKAG